MSQQQYQARTLPQVVSEAAVQFPVILGPEEDDSGSLLLAPGGPEIDADLREVGISARSAPAGYFGE